MAQKYIAPRFSKVARHGRQNSRILLTNDTTLVVPNRIVEKLQSDPKANTGREVKKLIAGYGPATAAK